MMKKIDKFNHMQQILNEMFEQVDKSEQEKIANYWSEVDYEYERWKERNGL